MTDTPKINRMYAGLDLATPKTVTATLPTDSAADPRDELIRRLAGVLREISGELDVDGNSMYCSSHEDCQRVARQALTTASQLGYGGENE